MPQRPHVTVVGLGPAGADLVSPDAAALLAEAQGEGRAFLRTARHPAAARFPHVAAFDGLYEAATTFEEVYAGVADALVGAAVAAAPAGIVYAVPGSPLVAEHTVDLLRRDARIVLTIVPALSFLDLAWVALGIDPLAEGVRLVDAEAFGGVAAGAGGPTLVAQCWSRHLLSEIKLSAPDDAGELPRPVLLHHLGLEDEQVRTVDWWDLDRTLEPDHLTSLYIPAVPGRDGGAAGAEMARLVTLMDTLRRQCPWDAAQTHASLMPHLVEESYEVLDALDGADSSEDAAAHLQEELGDLLFQIVFHAHLEDEAGRFDMADVARGVHDKLVHRHPHVFGSVDADTPEQVVSNWESIKKAEKGRRSVTEGIPSGLPALMLTTKLARKARAVGLEPEGDDAVGIATALAALGRQGAAAEPRADDPLAEDAGELGTALGELLYAVATLAQRLGIDAEQVLRSRALRLRAEILQAEGVPDDAEGTR
jgi:tetrapyrrole methylase family protein / MazG family protein